MSFREQLRASAGRRLRPAQSYGLHFFTSTTSEQQAAARKREKRQKMHVFCWMLQLFVLLLDQAIRRNDVNRIAVTVNVRNLHSDSNKRMSPSGRYYAPIGWSTSNALRHDGRGPLVL